MLVINGDTIPYNTSITFAGQPVHKVVVCHDPRYGEETVWTDTAPQGRIRMTWNNVVFPAVSCTYSNVADRCECQFGGMRMKYCGDCAFTCWQRCNFWEQCLTGCMCIDCVEGVGVAGTCYTVNAYPTTTESFGSFGREAYVCYSRDKTVNLTWTTGDGCSYTRETVGTGECQYHPMLHIGNYGAWNDMFCVDVPSITVSMGDIGTSFTTCLSADLYINAGSGYGTRPVELQKTGRTFPLSMTMCRSAIDLSSCFEYYYVTVEGCKVSDANGNAICFTRAQLTNGICVNFATAKLIN